MSRRSTGIIAGHRSWLWNASTACRLATWTACAGSAPTFKKLAANGVEIFFTQVFRDNFFHADMHPGNIFVDVTDPRNPALCRRGLRHRRYARGWRPALPGGKLPGLFRPRLPPRRTAACEFGLGTRQNARRRTRVGGTHSLRADLSTNPSKKFRSVRYC